MFVSTLTKLAIPVVACLVILAVTRKRGVSWRDDLGLKAASPAGAAGWLVLWLAWVAASEFVIERFGLQQAEAWPAYPPSILVMRIVAIGMAGPFFEELVARGVFFNLFRRTALGPPGAIIIVALGWALSHYRYDLPTIALVCADGVLLGLARHQSGSLWVPISMHVVGNLISIGQSLRL